MNILDIAIAKKLAGGGGGSGTNNYNDLSNLPKINDTTLSGNKSSSALGLQSEINSDSKLASDLVDDTNQDNKFVTSTEKNTWNAKQNAIDSDHKLSSDLVDDANKTNKFVTSTEKNTWNAKQNAIDSDHKLSSSLVSFSTAEAAALASGIDSTKVGQISANQTNILYVLNKSGSKNVLVPKYDKYTNNEVSYTVNADGTITVVIASTTAANRELPITDAISNVYDGMIISGSPSGNNIEYLITGLKSDGTYENEQFSYNQAHSTINRGTPKIKFSIYVTSGTAAQTVTIYPMVQDASITDFTFAKPALPNYDLTRLEAEDRASLAEVVDSGSKNLLQLAATTNTSVSGCHVTFSGTASVSATQWYGVEFTVSTSGSYVFAVKATSGTIPTTALYNITDDANVKLYDNGTGGNDTVYLQTGMRYKVGSYLHSGTSYNQQLDVMICTKAAFGVSQKFVPYKPNPFEVIRGSIDFAVDVADANTVYVTQIGRIVNIQFAVKFTNAIPNSETVIGTIKGVGLPAYTTRIMISQNSELFYPAEAIAYGMISSSNGNLSIRTLQSSATTMKSFFFNLTYTCKG